VCPPAGPTAHLGGRSPRLSTALSGVDFTTLLKFVP
jgi:hypothetical protein